MKLTLDPGAAALLDALHAAGYAAYAVGGCVRDSLLGRTAHDWDLCTSALPQQVMELFGTEQCIPTGLQHGTVTIKYGGQLYETTTFRTEGSYTDGRHPDAVQFVPDVREDLARRDFTINAMAYNAAEGLVDPFGGQKDLQNGLLRAVGEPQQRFTEDALRILRLYRFAARFGFTLDAATARAARQLAPHLDCISAERIQEELAKLLVAPQPGAYLEPAVLAVVLPELTPAALEAAKPVVDACPAGEENLPVRWAALLGTLGEADTRRVLKRLRCSNACIEETAVLVRETAGEGVCGSFLLGHETGHSIARPTACGSRVPPQRTLALGTPRCPAHTMQKGPFPEGKEPLLHCLNSQSRSDELQNCHLSSVAAASADLDDAGVAAVAVSVLGADLIKQLLCNIFLGDVGVDLTLGVQVAGLTQGDHLLGHGTNVLSASDSGLNLAIL